MGRMEQVEEEEEAALWGPSALPHYPGWPPATVCLAGLQDQECFLEEQSPIVLLSQAKHRTFLFIWRPHLVLLRVHSRDIPGCLPPRMAGTKSSLATMPGKGPPLSCCSYLECRLCVLVIWAGPQHCICPQALLDMIQSWREGEDIQTEKEGKKG